MTQAPKGETGKFPVAGVGREGTQHVANIRKKDGREHRGGSRTRDQERRGFPPIAATLPLAGSQNPLASMTVFSEPFR